MEGLSAQVRELDRRVKMIEDTVQSSEHLARQINELDGRVRRSETYISRLIKISAGLVVTLVVGAGLAAWFYHRHSAHTLKGRIDKLEAKTGQNIQHINQIAADLGGGIEVSNVKSDIPRPPNNFFELAHISSSLSPQIK